MRRILPLIALVALVLAPAQSEAEESVVFRLGAAGIEVLDTTEPGEHIIARFPLGGPLYDLIYLDDRLYVARGAAGITVLDVTNPERPRELFTLGKGQAAVKLTARGAALAVTDDDGSVIIYRPSQLAEPRPPGTIFPPPPRWHHQPVPVREPPLESARHMVAAGTTLLVGGFLLSAVGGMLLFQGQEAVRAAHERNVKADLACRQNHSSYCFNFDFSSLESIGWDLSGYVFLGLGAAHFATGIPVLAVGKYKQRRVIELHPSLLSMSDQPIAPRGLISGLSLKVSY